MKTELSKVDTDNYTLWKDRIFKFESTELSKVIKKIERFYNIKVQYSNSLQRSIKISGKLDLKEGQEETINRIAVTASVKIIKKGDFLYQIN
jgi:ferric-dicitrate binding protein FerR (iron transport regulator)